MSTLKNQIAQSRAQLLIRKPFYGSIVMRRDFVEDPTCRTAWTDGVTIGYNPEFVAKLSLDEKVFLWAHEASHIARKHHLRRGHRRPVQWNVATDHSINIGLISDGHSMIKGGLADQQFSNMSSEAIYARLPEQENGGSCSGSGEGDGFRDEVRDWPGDGKSGSKPTKAEIEAASQKLDRELIQAANMAKKRGDLPAGMERLIDEIKAPALDWRHLLRAYLRNAAKDDHTWHRPNRRYAWQGITLPSLYSERLGEIVVAIDTSGSTYGHQAQFVSECAYIARECKPSKLHLLYCDTRVSAETFEDMNSIPEFRPKGGGGTSFIPVFDWVSENDARPVVLVYLTDMWGNFPEVAPDYPVIWVDCADDGASAAPFGDYVPLRD